MPCDLEGGQEGRGSWSHPASAESRARGQLRPQQPAAPQGVCWGRGHSSAASPQQPCWVGWHLLSCIQILFYDSDWVQRPLFLPGWLGATRGQSGLSSCGRDPAGRTGPGPLPCRDWVPGGAPGWSQLRAGLCPSLLASRSFKAGTVALVSSCLPGAWWNEGTNSKGRGTEGYLACQAHQPHTSRAHGWPAAHTASLRRRGAGKGWA